MCWKCHCCGSHTDLNLKSYFCSLEGEMPSKLLHHRMEFLYYNYKPFLMSHHNKLKVKFYYELSEFIAVCCRQQMMLLECWMLILMRGQDMNRSALTPGARCSSMMTNSLTLAEILGDVGDSELPSNNTDIISCWWSDVITIRSRCHNNNNMTQFSSCWFIYCGLSHQPDCSSTCLLHNKQIKMNIVTTKMIRKFFETDIKV